MSNVMDAVTVEVYIVRRVRKQKIGHSTRIMSIEINGFCDAEFLPLKEAFAANFDEGMEVGASVAVTHLGRRG